MSRELLRALAADHADLFHTSPRFRLAMEHLVQLLPPFVETLAQQARDGDAEFMTRTEHLNRDLFSLPSPTPSQTKE